MPFISSSIVNGDVRECSVIWLSGILVFDGRCVEFPLPFSKIGEPPDRLSPCSAVEVVRSPSTSCSWFSTLYCCGCLCTFVD